MKRMLCILWCLFVICVQAQINESREIDSLKHLIQTEHQEIKQAFLNDQLAREYLGSNIDSLQKYANRSMLFSQKLKKYEYQVDAWNTLGMGSRKTGDYKQALEYHFKALKIAQTHNLANHYFYTTYSALCLAYTEQGNYTPAIEYGYKTLKATEIEKDTLNTAIVNNNLANVFFQIHNYPKALLHYQKALDIAVSLNNKFGQGLITSNMGSVYYQCGKLDSAKLFFDRSVMISQDIDDIGGVGINYLNLGSYYQRIKKYDKAIEYFRKAEKIFIEQDMQSNQADIYFNLSDVHFEMNHLNEAKQYAQKSLKLAKKTEGLSQKEAAYLMLSKIYDKLHQPAEAYANYKNYILFRDSISNDRNKEDQLKAGFEYEYSKRKYADSLDQILFRKIQQEALDREKLKTDSQRKITGIALIGCLIFFVLSIFIFKGYRDKQKANTIIGLQKKEVEFQKEIIEVKQKEILDSINYAKQIQHAVITPQDFLSQKFSDFFVLFKPKDIVSGDFYWAAEHDDKFYIAVCDSTGHGVPGAFMSLLNIGYLNEAIKEKNISKPNEVFNYVRTRLIENISKEGQQDGMDGILLCFDHKNQTITYASAHNAPILISSEQLIELPKDKMPIGKGEYEDGFNLYNLPAGKGDMIYLYTDGYADQFGGPKGKKFKYKTLNDLLLQISAKPLTQQKDELENVFAEWKSQLEQVDDVCVLGIRI